MTRWGLVATIRAPAREILEFAGYHIEQGAHRLYIYLDEPSADAEAALNAHPKIRVTVCDDAYWRKLGRNRPGKHQLRQTANATHAYTRKAEVDWLIHIDVDEFLWPDTRVGDHLEALPDSALCARVRPMEALAGTDGYFKAFIPSGPDRDRIVERLYPTFGPYVKGGFLSHVAGKLFVRTGLGAVTIKIHNAFRGDDMNPGQVELSDVALCHCHATSWDQWFAAYRYRLLKGSYRAELAPSRPRDKGGLSMHELLSMIEAEDGEAGIRAFHDELCADTPRLREALSREGLLRHCDLQLSHVLAAQFPDCT
ncbi:glycosyltransferase family 2 protein [Phaeobacter marinintestinus]|uniref:glycosyltransferase family 2 protein n=1 Tax=Falsiphaeobacter marinintestinus TaxID=1492905 RepID=UPI0011B5C541|nr:glycosyltransferase family 2 protein [Phaeobacter marinintestinus]